MGNQYWNDLFRSASKAAGIKGKENGYGDPAIQVFSRFLHESYSKIDREVLGYDGIYMEAVSWWNDNSYRFF